MTPVGHAIVGAVSCYVFGLKNKTDISTKKILLISSLIAVLPDCDFIISWFYPVQHRSFSHSLLFGVFTGTVAYLLLKSKAANKISVFMSLVFISLTHPLIDFFAADFNYPFGVMLFWPFSKEYYISPMFFIPGTVRSSLRDIFSLHNLLVIIYEIGVSVMFLTYWSLYRRTK